MTENKYKIKVEKLGCKIGQSILFKDVSFKIKPGDSLIINWKDGLGKSTFMETCAGLNSIYSGHVFWDGMNIQKIPREILMVLRSKTGYVFQKSALISNHTVFENIALPLRYHSEKSNAAINKLVKETVEQYGLSSIHHLLPELLTTSQSKIVSLARALITEPEILFLDEPSSGLDHESFSFMKDKLLELYEKKTTTILMLSTSLSMIRNLKFPVARIENSRLIYIL